MKSSIVALLFAVILTAGAWPLQASPTLTDPTAILLARCGELKSQYDGLLRRYGAEKARGDQLGVENSRLKGELESLYRKVGELKAELEREQGKVAQLQQIAPVVATDPTASQVWGRTLQSAYRQIATLERQVKTSQAKLEQGETRMVEAFVSAGIPPVYMGVADCGEGDWDCELWVKSSDRVNPDPRVYPTLMLIPSFSSRALEIIPELRQAKLAQRRAVPVKTYYEKLGFSVTVGQSIEGRSGVLMMFLASGMPNYKFEQIEKLAYHNAGAIRAIVDRIARLEGRVDVVERRLDVIEDQVGLLEDKFRWGLGLGGYYLAAEDPGPALKGVELEAYGDLRVTDALYFHFQFGTGIGDIRETSPATLAEFVGLQYQLSQGFSLTVGGRHRVAFLQKGELLNAVMGEAQARLRLTESLHLNLNAAYGSSWFSYKGPADGYWPAGVKIPTVKRPGKGSTGAIGAALEWEF